MRLLRGFRRMPRQLENKLGRRSNIAIFYCMYFAGVFSHIHIEYLCVAISLITLTNQTITKPRQLETSKPQNSTPENRTRDDIDSKPRTSKLTPAKEQGLRLCKGSLHTVYRILYPGNWRLRSNPKRTHIEIVPCLALR